MNSRSKGKKKTKVVVTNSSEEKIKPQDSIPEYQSEHVDTPTPSPGPKLQGGAGSSRKEHI